MSEPADFAETLKALVAGRTLSAEDAATVFGAIMAGDVSQIRASPLF